MEVQNEAPGAEPAGIELDAKSMRKEAITDMKKGLILYAAQRVIARNGLANVRIEDVAEEAGFSKASIYHYFPDKDALLIHLVIREQRAVYEKCLEVVERGLPFLDAIREFLTVLHEKFMVSFHSPGGSPQGQGAASSSAAMVSAFIASMNKHEDLLDEAVASKQDIFNLFVRIVARAKESGELTVPVDSEIVATIILAFLQSLVMEKLYGGGRRYGEDNLNKADHSNAIDQMFVFLRPWIKDGNPNRRWYDVNQNQ
jgi:AcrR family transcriptional regulator